MNAIRFDFVSDIVCPWCIIGYKQVDHALELYKEIEGEALDAEFHWHPFELNPHMPPEGQDVADHIAEKYGRTIQQGREARARMGKVGESVGFKFNFGDEMRVYNSFKAHKLLHWTGKMIGPKQQTALKMEFFKSYFQKRLDISDEALLMDALAAALPNADMAAAQSALSDQTIEAQVRAEQKMWRDRDIQGVPAIIIDQKFMVPGAQDAQTFVNVIRKIIHKRKSA